MTDKFTLNVGCGERTFATYPTDEYKCINFDERFLDCVDITGDVRDLSRFPNEAFDYILASDIIEHFPIAETLNILIEWGRVLKGSGILEFRLPNLEFICKRYVEGKHDAKYTSWLLYGGQDYSGNYHYVAFDRKWLCHILKEAGFEEVGFTEDGNNFIAKFRKV